MVRWIMLKLYYLWKSSKYTSTLKRETRETLKGYLLGVPPIYRYHPPLHEPFPGGLANIF
jgi:hypothetical protein